MGKIVAIHSYRGGTGKSNLVANLAAIIAERGNRIGIIDTDIQSPGIHVIFGLDEEKIKYSLNDYLWGKCQIEAAAHDVTPDQINDRGGKIFLIPSSLKVSEITRVLHEGYDVGLLNDGFQDLLERLNLDYLLIDTHPGLNEETLLSIAISDALIIILRPDHQDYQGTAVTVDVARKLGVPQMLLVLNKVLSSMDAAYLRQQVEGAYDASVAAIFPLTEEILQIGSADLFALRYPNHALTHEMEKVAAQIAN
jgi:MinD-like ATPase involved in chromosome partitioning or flagellar assembly